MITKDINVCQLGRDPLIIGRQMEDNYRQFVFDCSGFGDAESVTLVHKRSKDAAPYIVSTVDGTVLTWTITNTDTAYYGDGNAEIRINFADGLAKTATFATYVIKSITADTTIPEPLQSWYDAMIEYIDEHSVSPEELAQAIADYIEQHPIEAPVTSVNTKTGAVVLAASDVGALPTTTTAADLGAYVKPSGGIPVSDLNTTAKSRLMPTGGTTGQVLAKASGTNYDVAWTTVSGGGAVDSVNGQTGTVVLDADDVGALPDNTTAADLGAYVKPSGGIPKTDLASDVQTSLGKADTALQTAPVTSVNGQTGAVTVSVPTKTSDLTNDSGFITSAPVASVDGKTGAVTVIPTGGDTGQVLAKASATDRDVEWITPSGGGGSDWQVLHDSTTTEDAILQIAVTDISVSEFMVCIVATPSTNVQVYITPNNSQGNHYDQGYGRFSIGTGTTTGNPKYAWARIHHQVGPFLPVEKSADDLQYGGTATNMRTMAVVPSNAMAFTDKYTSISVATYQAVTSGTRIIVLGK